jgi:hypothetical protein
MAAMPAAATASMISARPPCSRTVTVLIERKRLFPERSRIVMRRASPPDRPRTARRPLRPQHLSSAVKQNAFVRGTECHRFLPTLLNKKGWLSTRSTHNRSVDRQEGSHCFGRNYLPSLTSVIPTNSHQANRMTSFSGFFVDVFSLSGSILCHFRQGRCVHVARAGKRRQKIRRP